MGISLECHPCLDSHRVLIIRRSNPDIQMPVVSCDRVFLVGSRSREPLPGNYCLENFKVPLSSNFYRIKSENKQILTLNWLNHSGFACSSFAQRHCHLRIRRTAYFLPSFLSQRRAGECRRSGPGCYSDQIGLILFLPSC